ncbi:MAG: Trehalose utilization [Gemmataceae bacterium]|nr:Trehalose utilization [Gemmataceae bacterium]
MKRFRLAAAALLATAVLIPATAADKPGPAAGDSPVIVLDGKDGIGKGKHVVLVSGDQEYRSEETIPQLAKILATRHGFKVTVLFTVDPKDGTIDPNINNIPGLEALKTADLMVIFTRFLNLPDDQMRYVAEYVESGKPVVGLRTSTHAFNIPGDRKYAKYGNGSGVKGWEGGFGRVVLGEKWVAHHGNHGKEGTRGIIAKGQEEHPILKGIKPGDIFGTTDVYTAKPPAESTILVYGQVTKTLEPDSAPVEGAKNDPMMPVAWTKTYKGESGTEGRAFNTTMGASQDFVYEGTRRMVVNACLWAVGLEGKIPDKTGVELVGEYKPTPFKFGGHKKDVKPADLFK